MLNDGHMSQEFAQVFGNAYCCGYCFVYVHDPVHAA